jgi:nitric oxide reductase NorD protein
MRPSLTPGQLIAWRQQLDCGFPQVAALFEDCMVEAASLLSTDGLNTYLEQARFLGKMGRGVEPVLIFLQEWPQTAKLLGESALDFVMDMVRAMTRSPNGRAIAPFLQSLAAVARRLPAQNKCSTI